MSLRFFTDHCVPNSVIQALRDAGHEVFILKEHIPRDSDDPVVITEAQELDAILVSLNGDFADIVTYPPSNYKKGLSRFRSEIIQRLSKPVKPVSDLPNLRRPADAAGF